MLDLLVPNWDERFLLSVISTVHVIAYHLNVLSVFTILNHKIEGQKVNQCFWTGFLAIFDVCVLKRKLFQAAFNIWVKFKFLLDCQSYS